MPPRKLTPEQEAQRARVIATISGPPLEPPAPRLGPRRLWQNAPGSDPRVASPVDGTPAEAQADRRLQRMREMLDDADAALFSGDAEASARAVDWVRGAWFAIAREDEQVSAIGSLLYAIDISARSLVDGTAQKDSRGRVQASIDRIDGALRHADRHLHEPKVHGPNDEPGMSTRDFRRTMAVADVINRFGAEHAEYAETLRTPGGRRLLRTAVADAADVWRTNFGGGKNRWEAARDVLALLFPRDSLPADLGDAYLQWRRKRRVELQESVPLPTRNKPGKKPKI